MSLYPVVFAFFAGLAAFGAPITDEELVKWGRENMPERGNPAMGVDSLRMLKLEVDAYELLKGAGIKMPKPDGLPGFVNIDLSGRCEKAYFTFVLSKAAPRFVLAFPGEGGGRSNEGTASLWLNTLGHFTDQGIAIHASRKALEEALAALTAGDQAKAQKAVQTFKDVCTPAAGSQVTGGGQKDLPAGSPATSEGGKVPGYVVPGI